MSSQTRMRLARRHIGLSQAELAERVGVHRSAVSHWESPGGHSPSLSNIRRVAKVANVHFEWLATGRGPMSISENVLLDSIKAAEGLFVDDALELRLIEAMRRAPVSARITLVEIAEHLSISKRSAQR